MVVSKFPFTVTFLINKNIGSVLICRKELKLALFSLTTLAPGLVQSGGWDRTPRQGCGRGPTEPLAARPPPSSAQSAGACLEPAVPCRPWCVAVSWIDRRLYTSRAPG